MIIEVIVNRIPFFPEWVAGTVAFYPFVVYKGEPSEKLRRHEWVHVEQIKRDGYFTFMRRYITNMINKVPYNEQPYEIEAYRKQNHNNKPWSKYKHKRFDLRLNKPEEN